MLNIGFIGKTENFEPHIRRIQKNTNINVIGKASYGTDTRLNSFHFSIPELNRIELIERADAILIDNSLPLSFSVLCDIVKKSKHIFAVEYLNLSVEEGIQLSKLTNESGSIVQIYNPFFYKPAIQWLNKNLVNPAYLDISYYDKESVDKNTLTSLLFMLFDATGMSPKKVAAVSFQAGKSNSWFYNVRLEYGNASVVNINYGSQSQQNEFKIKTYSEGQFISLNFLNKNFLCQDNPIDLSKLALNEFDIFIHSIMNKTKTMSNIEDYLSVLHIVQKINKKLSLFAS